jgi:hypothetical protein
MGSQMKTIWKTFGATLIGSISLPLMATEVLLADIALNKKSVQANNIINVSNQPGYDNQPSFTPDGKGLFYTSMQPGIAEKTQTDAIYYDFSSKSKDNVTKTKDLSEYSPIVITGGKYISFISQDQDNKQWIAKAEIESGKQYIINPHVEPVGYHAWGNNNDFALFVLGDVMTLQYFPNSERPEHIVVAENIGRSIRFNATKQLFSFSQGKEKQYLSVYAPKQNESKILKALPGNSVYYTWFDDNTVISADGTIIYSWQYNEEGEGDWQVWLDLSQHCDTQVTRLAVNANQSKLAFVCDEK